MLDTTSNLPRLVQLRSRDDIHYISQGRTIWVTGRAGFINPRSQQGLFVHKTRMVSRYRLTINGQPLRPLALSAVQQHSWLGYYRFAWKAEGKGPGQRAADPKNAVEIRVSRFVGNGCHEDFDVVSYADRPIRFDLQLEIDADFADQQEAGNQKRMQQGRLTRQWNALPAGGGELVFDYRAEHHYEHRGEKGDASIHRTLTIRIENTASPVSCDHQRISFGVALAPHQTWHACLAYIPTIEGKELRPLYGCQAFEGGDTEPDRRHEAFLREATGFQSPGMDGLAPMVLGAVRQAVYDLAALRMHDLDVNDRSWVVGGGLPTYIALFGRDPLLTGILASIADQGILRGTLAVLARHQADDFNDWRDAQPGRILHQMEDSPLGTLNYTPLGRYYGSLSSPPLYGEALAELWFWTGDEDLVRPWIEPALKALDWMDTYGDEDRDGFYEYKTRSEKGLKNQGWMDSSKSIVDEDGSVVDAPVASAEAQSWVYAAKRRLGLLLDWLGRDSEAQRLFREAEELKKRFNDRFWMQAEGYYGLGLDSHKRLIRTISSNPAMGLASGIVDEAHTRATVDRLWQEDMFTGWGIRTLSSQNPAYNPLSYQRGSVWPVENAVVATGLYRRALYADLQRLCRAQYETATLFAFYRFPEVFGGHPRDVSHPFPPPQSQADWPQAWSAGAAICFLRMLLGIVPFAAGNVLLVDPHLPAWLPEITLAGLRVGQSATTIRFFRRGDGSSSYEVLALRGPLDILHRSDPWSMLAGGASQVREAIDGVLAPS